MRRCAECSYGEFSQLTKNVECTLAAKDFSRCPNLVEQEDVLGTNEQVFSRERGYE